MTKKKLIKMLEDFKDDDNIIFGTYNGEYVPVSATRYNDDVIVMMDSRCVGERYYITQDLRVSKCGYFANPTDKFKGSSFYWNRDLCYHDLNMYLIRKQLQEKEN